MEFSYNHRQQPLNANDPLAPTSCLCHRATNAASMLLCTCCADDTDDDTGGTRHAPLQYPRPPNNRPNTDPTPLLPSCAPSPGVDTPHGCPATYVCLSTSATGVSLEPALAGRGTYRSLASGGLGMTAPDAHPPLPTRT